MYVLFTNNYKSSNKKNEKKEGRKGGDGDGGSVLFRTTNLIVLPRLNLHFNLN